MIIMYDVLHDADKWCLEGTPERTYFQCLIFQMKKKKAHHLHPRFSSAGQVSTQGR